MSIFKKEEHQSLRGGNGVITTYTKRIYLLGLWYLGKFIIFNLEPYSTIGEHYHFDSSEIYITFSRGVRFRESNKWKLVNFCRKGCAHCAKNTSKKRGIIFAFKF